MPEVKPLILGEMTPPMNVSLIENIAQTDKLVDFFARVKANGGEIGWDVETTPLKDYYFRRCRTMQFGNTQEQYVIDLLPFCDGNPEVLFSCQGDYGVNLTSKLKELLEVIRPVICTKDFLKIGVNLAFEYETHYWNFGLRTFHFYDAMMAEKCIWAGVKGMKQYALFSMGEMMEQYFRIEIDKSLQESFTLDGVLTQDQINYAALDTRLPMGIKTVQGIIASGVKLATLKAKQSAAVKFFEHLEPKTPGTGEPVVMGDNLNEVIQIENDAIGMFEDMHVHGERLDRERWLKRVQKSKDRLKEVYETILDPFFIPLVGDKNKVNTDAEIEAAEALWKSYNTISPQELEIKKAISKQPKGSADRDLLETHRAVLETVRKEKKEELKKIASDMKKNRTKVKNLAAKCEGNALINYSSNAQLMAVLKEVKGLKSLKSMDDEVLEKFEHIPVMKGIRELHGLEKEIGTYGDQWAQEWSTKPCKEEGWLHPGDGRLHCVFNQYDAETGRSSSEKPNGQNLPQDTEVRSCFIADPPNEFIRVSNCCEKDANQYTLDGQTYVCSGCYKEIPKSETHAEEYVIITADMSGAELRIIAELAEDPIWIGAFSRGEDVHSVGTEILYPEEWFAGTESGCKYYALKENGEPARQKCKCTKHKELRDKTKSLNFLLAYGGGPSKLAKNIKQTIEKAQELMAKHEAKFPRIWKYLKDSGNKARMLKKSFDMFGRRRIFPEPTWDRAKAKFIGDNEKLLRLDENEYIPKVALFTEYHGRKPDQDELYELTHRQPTSKEISKTMGGMAGGIERQGKNHEAQSANATIIKLAGGCSHDNMGKPFLWHIFPLYRARLQKMVHDELVVSCPKQYAQTVAEAIGDAFKRAAAMRMHSVIMEFEFNIGGFWSK